jgi:hypothetical protein
MHQDHERATLCGLLLDPKKMPEVLALGLEPDDFFSKPHVKIFEVMVDLHREGKSWNCNIIATELERREQFEVVGGDHYLEVVANSIATAVETVQHAAYVKQDSDLRLDQWRGNEMARDALSRVYTHAQVVERDRARAADIEGERREPEDEPTITDWPEPPAAAAFAGLAGEAVDAILPHTEADAAAILSQFLIGFGNAIDRTMHIVADGARHHANEYGVLVGDTGRARKGTAWRRARAILSWAIEEWTRTNIVMGAASGEGIIYRLRDERPETVGQKGVPNAPDPGVADKRLLILDEEFARVLRMSDRTGNTLADILRLGWDGETLENATKNSPLKASNPHLSFIAHTTIEELAECLPLVDLHNGLGNRILWACVRRSKILPFGGQVPEKLIQDIGEGLRLAIEFARSRGEIGMTETARTVWSDLYREITEPRSGIYGAATARAEAHLLRLALMYAALDKAEAIGPKHLASAKAMWDFHDRSAAYLFGKRASDPDVNKLLDALKAAANGLTRTEIKRDVFRGHKTSEALAKLLSGMLAKNLIHRSTEKTSGRPAERFSHGPTFSAEAAH